MTRPKRTSPAQGHSQTQQPTQVQRDRPTSYASWSDIHQSAGTSGGAATGTGTSTGTWTNTANSGDMTPMARWLNEPSRQGPYDNVGYVAAETAETQTQTQTQHGQGNGGGSATYTDAGPWYAGK